ncbi:MAG TPA: DUF4255 domain-containing protein [Beijerinckiaceae bacterium]|jgi:hypothetical protein
MTDFPGLAAATASLQRFFQLSFADREPLDGSPTGVAIVRTEDLDPAAFSGLVERPALTVHVYRVDADPTMRSAFAAAENGSGQRRPALALQLHFLITPWATNADEELRILGRAMQALEDTPILSGPLLSSQGWSPDDTLQILLEPMDTHALLRIFDSLPVPYRLSAPYLARVLRLTGRRVEGPPVVTSVLGVRPSLAEGVT